MSEPLNDIIFQDYYNMDVEQFALYNNALYIHNSVNQYDNDEYEYAYRDDDYFDTEFYLNTEKDNNYEIQIKQCQEEEQEKYKEKKQEKYKEKECSLKDLIYHYVKNLFV